MNDTINIVLATDGNYAQHATVAMASVLCNTQLPQRLHFFIIDDGIDENNKQKMQSSVIDLGGAISFLNTQEVDLNDVYVSGNLTKAAYYRLAIPKLLPNIVSKVIYLDCDLLVLKDIVQLWKLDLHGKPIAATEDFGILSSSKKSAEKAKNLVWKAEFSYFNSGVMIIDVSQWRQQNFADGLLQLVCERKFRHHDQDALNYFFMNNWAKMPLEWNVIPPIFNMPLRIAMNSTFRAKALNALKKIAIIHYAGGYKPWEYDISRGFNDKYYLYLEKTRYRDAKMPQPNPKKKKHSLSRQLWRLKWAAFVKRINN